MNYFKNKCIFLDRDGTLIVDKGYQIDKDKLEFISLVPETLKKWKDKGYLLIVVTNQSGIARGYFSMEQVKEFNNALNNKLFEMVNIKIDDFYICPHFKNGIISPYNIECSCRKPHPELIYRAQRDYNIDLKQSYMFGDKDSDLKLGLITNLKGAFLVDTKHQLNTFANIIK